MPGTVARPAGNPAQVEAFAQQLAAAGGSAGTAAGGLLQQTGLIREQAQWSGAAADAYTAFTSGLSHAVGTLEGPLTQAAGVLREYAASLRTAQARVDAYAAASAQLARPLYLAPSAPVTAPLVSPAAAQLAGLEQDAQAAVAAFQAQAQATAARLRQLAGEMNSKFFHAAGPFAGLLNKAGQALDASQAQAAAQQLAAAEKSGNLTQITALQQDILRRVKLGDTAWLTSFYNHGAPAVASLAGVLHGINGQGWTVLTSQDQQTLNAYAQGLAAADKAGGLTQTTISAFAQAPNLWSSGMLFKYGPPGSAYGTQEQKLVLGPNGKLVQGKENLLAQVTQSIEQARLKGGYTIPLAGASIPTGAAGSAWVTQSLAKFDPAQTMLTLATQNGAAAREVLAGPAGQQIAASLMTHPVTSFQPMFGSHGSLHGFAPTAPPAYFNGQQIPMNQWPAHPVTMSPNTIGHFFSAATGAPRGTGVPAYNATQAAMHLVQATPPPAGTNGVPLPEPIRQSLLHTAQHYLLDLAQSTGNVHNSLGVLAYHAPGNPWTFNIPGHTTTNFLQQIVSSPRDGGVLMASAKTALGQYYAASVTHTLPPVFQHTNIDLSMAQLVGQIKAQQGQLLVQSAAKLDAVHAQYNALLNFATGPVMPVIGVPLANAQAVAGMFGVQMPQFSTNNAAAASFAAGQSFAQAQMDLKLPMTLALLRAHAIPASMLHGQPWYQNGQVVINDQTAKPFTEWYTTLGHIDHLDSTLSGYQQAMGIQQTLGQQGAG